ncbi:organic cation transporter protein-like isoform X1 [Cloeon dipterum]|uniref:organic cation transporter protein-like isoform X1 n=2 Tax=Cloeon dipterum TaxID=197152 RepID=UPI0032204C0C
MVKLKRFGMGLRGIASWQSLTMPPSESSDPVIVALGYFGPWQWRMLLLVALVKIPAAWQMMSILFLASSPESFGGMYFCARTDKDRWTPQEWIEKWHPKSNKYLNGFDPCFVYAGYANDSAPLPYNDGLIECKNFEFLVDRTTMITEWSLVCDRNRLINVVQSLYLFGIFCGGVVTYSLLKIISPRAIIVSGAALQVAAGIALALQPIYILHCFLKFLVGLSACIMFSAGYQIVVDVTSGQPKLIAGVCYELFWSFGALSLGWMNEAAGSWSNLQLMITCPTLLFIILCWFLPDSPRWLIAHGKHKQAENLLRSAAKVNGNILPDDFAVSKPDKPATKNDAEKEPLEKMKVFCCQLIWISTIVTYYGGLLNFRNVGGTNLPGRTTIAGAAEIVGTMIGLVLVLKSRYKIGFMSFLLFIGGICCVCSWAITPNFMGSRGGWTMVGLAVVGRISIACSLAVMTNGGTADYIPIARRPFIIMLLLTGGRFFLMGAPFLNSLAFYADSITLSAYGVLILVAALSSFYLFFTSEYKHGPLTTRILPKASSSIKPKEPSDENIVGTHFNPCFVNDEGIERVI